MDYVKDWIIPYLAEIERQNDMAPRTLAPPRSYRVRQSFSRRPEDALPFVAVVSTGTDPGRRPVRDGDGLTRAWWLVAVGAAASASDSQAAKDVAGYYGAAIRGLMIQDQSLGGWAYGCEWQAEMYDDFPISQERTIGAARLVFSVEVHDVIDTFGGFRSLPINPYADPGPDPIVQRGKTYIEFEQEDE